MTVRIDGDDYPVVNTEDRHRNPDPAMEPDTGSVKSESGADEHGKTRC
ncbi:hypothetical protein [Halanaeroarchaeum sulfurireducens]|nr:hypothetical protein [Halanaeroarchaeum sulfurireducens]